MSYIERKQCEAPCNDERQRAVSTRFLSISVMRISYVLGTRDVRKIRENLGKAMLILLL